MIISFPAGTKAIKILQVAAYAEDQDIEFELKEGVSQPGATELATPPTGPKMMPTVERVRQLPQDNDPLWRPGHHDDIACNDRACKHIVHYGAQPL